ncbi:hypothetical protein C8R44DRAFT_952016 [Mycena epipterygia]|nr:hypothetical protein C8R44DRAFT_952016 [Mycena epipterygia]
MFNTKSFLALALVAISSMASATPTAGKRGVAVPDASVTIEVCTSVNTGCVTIPVISDDCLNLTGGLTFLDKEISTAQIPGGFICTFFQDFGCTATGVHNAPTDSEVVLQQGSWNLEVAPGVGGTTNFEDLTSSISCSPI